LISPILITGANGHLGRRLIATLPSSYAVEALVRSRRAEETLLTHVGDREGLNVTIADPRDADAIVDVGRQCGSVVHLIGTIKETRGSAYADADEKPAQALSNATSRLALRQIIYLSILGTDPASSSRCLRSRAMAEEILMSSPTAVAVIRVPMVVGEKDRASLALARRAAAKRVVLFRGASLEQPIYAGDVVAAIINMLKAPAPVDQVFDLAGPTSLTQRDLILRAAALRNNRPSIYSLPLLLGFVLARILELSQRNPRLTREMLRVLDHDDAIDPGSAAAALNIDLTPLDQTLQRCVVNRLP
jgi:uncharacterized protein YbjT (DUF2867 family)